MADDKPIIIIKKKGGHGGHHGGAWKVAYADFVTAMMAFFMVMWLVNSASSPTKENIASYFRRPGIFQSGSGAPLLIGESGILDGMPPPMGQEKGKKGAESGGRQQYKKKSGTDESNDPNEVTYRGEKDQVNPLIDKSEEAGIKTTEPGEDLSRAKKDQDKAQEIADQIRQKIAGSPELSTLLGVVDIKIEADGLKIEIMDTDKNSMFASGSASISEDAKMAFYKVTEVFKKLNTSIDIIGHTDAKPFGTWRGGYSNWELSADRANAARRLMEANGIAPDRIKSVIGRAEKDLKYKNEPLAPGNRRISLKMKFDFDKTVDMSKDPLALDKLPEYRQEYEDKKQALRDAQAKKEEEEKTHSLTVKEITEKKDKGIVIIPQEQEKKQEEITHSKDKIFGDSPVMTVPNLIYGDH